MDTLPARLLLLLLWVPAVAGAHPGIFHRRITADDGVALALYRYVPEVDTGQPPIFLAPDLGMNRAALDSGQEGIARFLWEHGREVFLLEPRGHGASAGHGRFGLEDLVARDLPAAFASIQALHPGEVDVVAWGFTGTLVLAATPRELRGRVRRVVALATPVDASLPNPAARGLLAGRGALRGCGLDPACRRTLELLFTRHGLLAGSSVARLEAEAFEDLGPGASAQLLGWMTRGDLPLHGGDTVRQRLAQYDRPTLLLMGLSDNWVHPEHVSRIREVAPRAPVQVKLLSRLDLLGEDYAHLSLVQGASAPTDVFIPLLRFLGPDASLAREGVQ